MNLYAAIAIGIVVGLIFTLCMGALSNRLIARRRRTSPLPFEGVPDPFEGVPDDDGDPAFAPPGPVTPSHPKWICGTCEHTRAVHAGSEGCDVPGCTCAGWVKPPVGAS